MPLMTEFPAIFFYWLNILLPCKLALSLTKHHRLDSYWNTVSRDRRRGASRSHVLILRPLRRNGLAGRGAGTTRTTFRGIPHHKVLLPSLGDSTRPHRS